MTTDTGASMYSMTGFGSAEASGEGSHVHISVRSLNHRHLDIRLLLPDVLRSKEDALAGMVRERLRRGRVEVTVKLDCEVSSESELLDRDLVRRMAAEIAELEQQGLVSGGLRAGDLLTWLPSRSTMASNDLAPLLEMVSDCLNSALSGLVAARNEEGSRLHGFLSGRIQRVREIADELVIRRQAVESSLREDYRSRLEELGATEALGEERIALEVAAAIDKSSISEETDRLTAHCDHFEDVAGSAAPSGRKLDFIVQEIFRELNTIAAKARNSESVHLAIEGKTVCEDLREQLRNVE